jgi:hypothetical protein
MDNIDEKKQLSKCFKSYLNAKKYYDTDINKSVEYFIQCIKLADIYQNKNGNGNGNGNKNGNRNENNNVFDIIEETKLECYKYININIESLLFSINIKKNNSINLFKIVEEGTIDKLKKIKFNEVEFNVYNEYGLTPLHYAIKYGDTSFIKQCLILGANIDQTNVNGYTLLEYSCLEKDPNMITFLINHGADMTKHLNVRSCKKIINIGNDIDIVLLEKYIILEGEKCKLRLNINEINYLQSIYHLIDMNDIISIKYKKEIINMNDILINLNLLLSLFDEISRNTYISILEEELSYNLKNSLDCPTNKLEIILYNLIPFIKYEYNIKLKWLFHSEIKFLILKMLKKNSNINILYVEKELRNHMINTYIKNNIVPSGFIHIILFQIINRFIL